MIWMTKYVGVDNTISSLSDFLIVTTAAAIAFSAAPGAIAFSHPIGTLTEFRRRQSP